MVTSPGILTGDEQLSTTSPIYIDIAKFVVAIQCADVEMEARIRRRYAAFLTPPTTTVAATISLTIEPGARFVEIKPGSWIIETAAVDGVVNFTSYLEKGSFDLASRHGVLTMAPEAHVENYLRVVYAHLCLNANSLLLHAAGVIREGLGYVFFGPSGAGKTTTSRLAAATADVLSDDLVILREHEDGYHLYGVPFKGELSDAPRANQTAPLQAIFRLRQDRRHAIQPLPRIVATAELAGAAPFVNNDKSLADQLLGVCHHLANAVPVQTLHFRRDDGFWQVIDEQNRVLSQTASANGR